MTKLQKLTCARVMKVIFYLLGFPLLLLCVAKDSMLFFNQDVFSETAKNGITAVFLIWVGLALVQIGLYFVMKKQQALRTIILIILAVALMIAPVAGLDSANEKKLEELRTEYADKGVTIEDYSLQKQWFVALSKDKRENGYSYKFTDKIYNLIRIYGLGGYYPGMYLTRSQLNTTAYFKLNLDDGDDKIINITADNPDVFADIVKQSPYAFNPNGLLADNYIFGVNNAIDLLIRYNEYAKLSVYRQVELARPEAIAGGCYFLDGNTYRPLKEDVSESATVFYEKLSISDAYSKMVKEINASATDPTAYDSNAWYNYVNDVTDILDTRTGENVKYSTLKAEADNYVLTSDRLNDVLQTLFEYLGKNPGLNDLIDQLNFDGILKLVNLLLKEDNTNINSGAIGNTITQLLYGWNNGKGGSTTGLALPAQYLFGNLKLSDSKTKTEVGKIDSVTGGTISPGKAEANQYYVFVGTYTDNPEDPSKPIFTLSYEPYDSTKHFVGEFDENELNKKRFDGTFYKEEDLAVIYEAYKTNLEANNEHPATAALVDIIKSLQPALGLVGGLLNISDMIGGLVPGLDLATLLPKIGITSEVLDSVVNEVLGKIDLSGLTVEDVQGILDSILGELSYYQHPLLKKCWQSDFVSETDKALDTTAGTKVDMSDYAWIKYACEDFGITNGCALAARGGLLTGKTIGNGTSADEAMSLTELYQLKADLSYKTEMYPLLAARRYMTMWAGVLALSIFFTAYFYNKERLYAYELVLNGGEY